MFKLIRNNQVSFFNEKPVVFGALNFKLYEWSPTVGEWIQIDGKI